MTILPSLEIFEKYISNSRDRVFSDINTIFFNENIHFLISPTFVSIMEKHFNDIELIQTLIVELSDKNRIPSNIIDNSDDAFFEKFYKDNCDSDGCLLVLTINDNPSIPHYKYSLRSQQHKNKEYIIFELLKSNVLSFHYYDFNSNAEIQNLIKTVFTYPKNIGRISIYNRYSEHNYFTFLKNKSIYYYNLITGTINLRKTEFIRIENDLKANLGRNVVLKTTNDLNKIHERKILFNHFILTFDNSFDNSVINEPSWKIDIEIDRKTCSQEWAKKNKYFTRL